MDSVAASRVVIWTFLVVLVVLEISLIQTWTQIWQALRLSLEEEKARQEREAADRAKAEASTDLEKIDESKEDNNDKDKDVNMEDAK